MIRKEVRTITYILELPTTGKLLNDAMYQAWQEYKQITGIGVESENWATVTTDWELDSTVISLNLEVK